MPSEKCSADLIEEPRGQETVIIALRGSSPTEIVARPEKFIAFADHDPRALVVKPEMPLHRAWYFYRRRGFKRRHVRDRKSNDYGFAVALTFDDQDDDARPVLRSLFSPGQMFVVPE